MKRIYLIGALLGAICATTSCSSDEDFKNQVDESNAIQFGTYVGRNSKLLSTKAIENLDSLKKQGFGVFAFYTGQSDWDGYDGVAKETPNYMNNQKVVWNNTDQAWTYSPLKYWPNNTGDKVSFFAYAPYDASKAWKTNSVGYITFTVDNDVTKQVDLLCCKGVTNQTKQSTTGKVTFNFQHALARIGFTAAYAADETTVGNNKLYPNTTITINKVVLRKADATTETEGAFYTNGDLSMVNNDWDISRSQGLQAFTLNSDNFESNVLNSTVNKIDLLNKKDSYIMIIPQNTEFEVYIEYTVTTTDSSLPGDKSEIANKITTKVSAINFEANKSYTLNLVLGMTSVKIDAVYNDWENGTSQTVVLPANN